MARNLRPTPAKDQKGKYKFHVATLKRALKRSLSAMRL
jgi:hypothetical protein